MCQGGGYVSRQTTLNGEVSAGFGFLRPWLGTIENTYPLIDNIPIQPQQEAMSYISTRLACHKRVGEEPDEMDEMVRL